MITNGIPNDFYLIYSVYRVLFRCGFVQVKPGYGDYEYCQRTGCSFTTKTDVKATASEHYIVNGECTECGFTVNDLADFFVEPNSLVNGGYILFSSDLTDKTISLVKSLGVTDEEISSIRRILIK